MKRLPVIMICENLDKEKIRKFAQKYKIHNEFFIRNYKKGEETFWAEVETAAGEFKTKEDALERFEKEFGPYRNEMEERCFFIVHKESDRIIGTATAWYNNEFKGERYGRVHWVGIHPDFQGRKLAKPLLAEVMLCLAKHHDKAYLTSQTTSYKAINMYLDFGFVPMIADDEAMKTWKYLENILSRKII
ncbi:MAG TPA: GNAT family N-acetyltransferase [Clostridiaceae bacterium]|nr:GNAT family N-acetyltransferase [Clostridiaceae bacterium]